MIDLRCKFAGRKDVEKRAGSQQQYIKQGNFRRRSTCAENLTNLAKCLVNYSTNKSEWLFNTKKKGTSICAGITLKVFILIRSTKETAREDKRQSKGSLWRHAVILCIFKRKYCKCILYSIPNCFFIQNN